MTGMQRLLESESETDPLAHLPGSKANELVKKIAQKLTPVPLRFVEDDAAAAAAAAKEEPKEGEVEVETVTVQKKVLEPHQFLHLHHMKTGGTSIDKLVRCAVNRLKKESMFDAPYFSIHECSRNRFTTCLMDPNASCRTSMKNAAVMSYCSALKYLDEFGWWELGKDSTQTTPFDQVNPVKAVTVLRDPIDRVWSMYRFQTKNCYKCRKLKDIYQQLEKGEDTGLDKLCLDQIQNHEVNNLLSTEWPLEVTDHVRLAGKDEIITTEDGTVKSADLLFDLMVREAIDNMKGFFTVVGITEELEETVKILGKVFPWLQEDANADLGTTSQCTLSHANKSPSNNRCAQENTHWDLPAHPDDETRALIAKYNQLDVQLYEAAVAYFSLQKEAMETL